MPWQPCKALVRAECSETVENARARFAVVNYFACAHVVVQGRHVAVAVVAEMVEFGTEGPKVGVCWVPAASDKICPQYRRVEHSNEAVPEHVVLEEGGERPWRPVLRKVVVFW